MLCSQTGKNIRRFVIPYLSKTEIVAALCNGLENLAAESIVALVLREIKLWGTMLACVLSKVTTKGNSTYG